VLEVEGLCSHPRPQEVIGLDDDRHRDNELTTEASDQLCGDMVGLVSPVGGRDQRTRVRDDLQRASTRSHRVRSAARPRSSGLEPGALDDLASVARQHSGDLRLALTVEIVNAPLQLAQSVEGGLAIPRDLAIELAIAVLSLSELHPCDCPERAPGTLAVAYSGNPAAWTASDLVLKIRMRASLPSRTVKM
jgi:hypothetical protein